MPASFAAIAQDRESRAVARDATGDSRRAAGDALARRLILSVFVLVAGCASQPAKAPRAKASAAAAELREECKKSGVVGFRIRGVAAFSTDEDFCFLPPQEEMPAPVADLLRQIGATHDEAALKLGVPFEKLAPNGVRIQLATGPGSTSIQPPNVIAFGTGAPDSPLPRSLETTWGQNMLLGEAFADLVTVHMTGRRRFTMSNHGGLLPNGLVFQTVVADKLTFDAMSGASRASAIEDTALAMDAIESKQGPVTSAKSFLRIFFTQSGTPAMNKTNYSCWGKLGDPSGDCKVTCHALE